MSVPPTLRAEGTSKVAAIEADRGGKSGFQMDHGKHPSLNELCLIAGRTSCIRGIGHLAIEQCDTMSNIGEAATSEGTHELRRMGQSYPT